MNNLLLFYDTETTGLPDWGQPSDAPQQPHIVQLAACVVDTDTRQVIQSMDVIIQPAGWVIPKEVTDIHGITTEYAQDVGVSEEMAIHMLLALRRMRTRVGHNESFDARIIRIAIKRYMSESTAEEWKTSKAECTAVLSTPHCKLPPTAKMVAAKRNHFKTPTLVEAHNHFFPGESFAAHSAMADVLACLRVYWAIKGPQEPQIAAGPPVVKQEEEFTV